MKRYLSNVWIATLALLKVADKWVNAVFGGDPQEYISSRVGKRHDSNERFWARIINSLFFWQKDHCTASIQPDEGDDAIL